MNVAGAPVDHIEVYDNALDEAFCREIIAKFEASHEQHRGLTRDGVDVTRKDSYDINITTSPEWRPILARVLAVTSRYFVAYMRKYSFTLFGAVAAARVDQVTGERVTITREEIEQLPDRELAQVITRLYRPGMINAQKYLRGVGGYHQWHSEHCPADRSCETLHRVLFFMYYLNTVDEGGETAFFYQKREVTPRQGRMVIAPAGFTHTHKGNVPLSDDKYILTSWVLFQRAETLFGECSGT